MTALGSDDRRSLKKVVDSLSANNVCVTKTQDRRVIELLKSPELEWDFFAMGRVRTKTVKKSARLIIEKYYSRLTLDFQTNKRICDEVAIIPSKRLRNKIAGFVTHLMTRIQKGPVRGISLKLQEEERERRMDFVPEVSAVETDYVEVDADTRDMLRALDLANLPGIVFQPASGSRDAGRRMYGGDRRGDRR